MRRVLALSLLFIAFLPCLGQATNDQQTSLPREPHALYAAAASHYDFSSPELKPWHMKVSYHFLDAKGNSSEEGTWEHWWASPKVYRSHLTRAGVEYATWSTAQGQRYQKESGGQAHYFERTLDRMLISPLPDAEAVESGMIEFDFRRLPVAKPRFSCLVAKAPKLQGPAPEDLGLTLNNYYCFDPLKSALLIHHFIGLRFEFGDFVGMQGRYLPRQVTVSYGKQELFSATVDLIDGTNPSDPAFQPPVDATLSPLDVEKNGRSMTAPKAVKTAPLANLRLAGKSGEVAVIVFALVIGADGSVHDLEVLTPLAPSRTQALLDWVKQSQYEPGRLDGKLVAVDEMFQLVIPFH